MSDVHRDGAAVAPGLQSPGVLTFLIADLRGYTRFTSAHGDQAAARLAERFAALAEEVAGAHGGTLVETRGDEVLLAFVSVRSALQAALTFSARLTQERGAGLPLDAGMGLDIGEAVAVRGGYRGAALNVASRLCALADTGMVLATEAVVRLARQVDGVTWTDRGLIALKGIETHVRVYQVEMEGTEPSTALLRSSSGTEEALPLYPTPFVGRARELAELGDLLQDSSTRLVTLVGPGGTGKTRLAVQAAADAATGTRRSIGFVSLASVTDPLLVLPTIARAVGVVERTGTDLADQVVEHLSGRDMVLVLDNFEHLRQASDVLTRFTRSCPLLTLLVTSRAVLNQYGEQVYDVAPLRPPPRAEANNPAALLRWESVALFVERARAARSSFQLTPDNASTVAEICRRLDGLPLAIELAAARVRVLPPAALLARLTGNIDVLSGGAHDLPPRHRMLRDTIRWSYELLDPTAQDVFAQLSVFAGGCSLEAAEAVCQAHGECMLDVVSLLVENSLLVQEGEEEPRFRMLQTIHEYARSRLGDSSTDGETARRHALYFLALTETAEPALRGEEQALWIGRLEREHDNVRAALVWALRAPEADLALRIGAAMWRFWWAQGYLTEGRRWLEQSLQTGQGPPHLRAATLTGLANLLWAQGDLSASEAMHRQALGLREHLGDVEGMARSLNNLGLVREQGGDFAEAVTWYERALTAARTVNDRWSMALILGNLGGVRGYLGQSEQAAELARESLAIFQSLGDRASEARVLNNLVTLALDRGAAAEAAQLQCQSFEAFTALGNQENLAFSLENASRILVQLGALHTATVLWGAADALRQVLGQPLPPAVYQERDQMLAQLRDRLGQAEFEETLARGRSLSGSEAADLAISALS